MAVTIGILEMRLAGNIVVPAASAARAMRYSSFAVANDPEAIGRMIEDALASLHVDSTSRWEDPTLCAIPAETLKASIPDALHSRVLLLCKDENELQSIPADLGDCPVLIDNRRAEIVQEEIWRVFHRYTTWVGHMKTVLLMSGGYQELLDECPRVFDDFISITDSSFRLIGCAGEPPVDDPVVSHLVKHGYHSEKTVELFRSLGLLESWKTQSGVTRIEGTPVVNTPSLSFIVRMRGSYFIHVVLQLTSGKALSQGLVDTFTIFNNYVSLYATHTWNEQERFSTDVSGLLSELIRVGEGECDAVVPLRRMGIPAINDFRMYVVELSHGQSDSESRLGYYAWRLTEHIPQAKAAIVDGRIALLYWDDRNDSSRSFNLIEEQLGQFKERYDIRVGASDNFQRLGMSKVAFGQACAALACGAHRAASLSQSILPKEEGLVVRFADMLPMVVYWGGDQYASLVDEHLAQCAARAVLDYDAETGSNLVAVLYSYLANDRNAAKAAELLFMHRNTVVYQLKKLEKDFGLDLEDSQSCRLIALELELLMARMPRKL